MENIKDIWFKTKIDLEELAEKIGLANSSYDSENYWEWVIGSYKSYQLDITRSHLVEPHKTETRIFILGNEHFFRRVYFLKLFTKLRSIGIKNITLGNWEYIAGNEYEMHEARKIN